MVDFDSLISGVESAAQAERDAQKREQEAEAEEGRRRRVAIQDRMDRVILPTFEEASTKLQARNYTFTYKALQVGGLTHAIAFQIGKNRKLALVAYQLTLSIEEFSLYSFLTSQGSPLTPESVGARPVDVRSHFGLSGREPQDAALVGTIIRHLLEGIQND